MTESRSSQFKKRFHIVLIAVLLLSFYGTGVLDCLLNPRFTGKISVGNVISAFFTTQQTILVFPIMFICLAGIALYIAYKAWKESLLDDKMGRNFRYSAKISPYGDAHVMEPYEYVDIAQIRKMEDCKGIIVGQLKENGEECVDFNANRINSHMYVTAMSGSGKTYGFVKPYIFQSVKRRHSLIMTDLKGELYAETAGFLMDNGYRVRRLDFKNLEISDGWDCLKLLRGKNMRTKVQIFSNAVITNISSNSDKDNIHAQGADSLLQALILRVLLGHDFPEEEKNIRSVYQLLQNPAGYSFLDTMFDKNSLTEEELPCLPPYLAFKQASTNLASNMATHLANGLTRFQDDLLCKVLSTDDIDLTLPGREPCAYYCIFPDDHDTYRFVISLFFTMLFIELVDFADDQPTRKLPIPVDFLLDEFPSIGIIPDWAKKMSTVRSRDISCVMITQDFTQLKQNYRDTWPTILNNCGAIITLGINEMETAEWISKRIGEASIEVGSSMEQAVAGRRRKLITRESVGVGKRNLFTPSEIFEIGQDNNLVVIAGRNPIFSNKTPFTIFKEAELLREIQKEEIIRNDDKFEKQVFRDCENEYVRQFWETHNIKMAGDPGDLSDAMYVEAALDPISMVFAAIKEDARAIWSLVKGLFYRRKRFSADPNEAISTPLSHRERHLSNETADPCAFEIFYQQYKARLAAVPISMTSSSGISDFELDDEFMDSEQGNPATYKVPPSECEPPKDHTAELAPLREEEKAPEPKPKSSLPPEMSKRKPRFENMRANSVPEQKGCEEYQSQNAGYSSPPVKSKKQRPQEEAG